MESSGIPDALLFVLYVNVIFFRVECDVIIDQGIQSRSICVYLIIIHCNVVTILMLYIDFDLLFVSHFSTICLN